MLATSGATAALVLATSAGAETSMLDPQGPAAAHVANLWWIMLGLSAVVFVVVMAFLVAALLRSRRRGEGDAGPAAPSTRPILIGTILTAAVVVALVGLTFWTLRALVSPGAPTALAIQITGHQYWWEVRYPDSGVVTANEIHIPTGEPVAIRLTSDDVIHSFWVPELAGKLDLIPGRINAYWIEADRPGVYLGECAEFCGIEHALMRFRVIAQPPAEFAAWIDAQRQPAAQPVADSLVAQGQTLFMTSGCLACHTVRGTNATGQLGPDLTHVASRGTLAAGVLANNVGNLGGWVVNPQGIKPGSLMPSTPLDGKDLQGLLAYLESLK